MRRKQKPEPFYDMNDESDDIAEAVNPDHWIADHPSSEAQDDEATD